MKKVKKMRRCHDERMIMGVCGGVGEYFAVDPNLVRLAFIGTAVLWGWGALIYVAAAFLLPLEATAADRTVEAPVPPA